MLLNTNKYKKLEFFAKPDEEVGDNQKSLQNSGLIRIYQLINQEKMLMETFHIRGWEFQFYEIMLRPYSSYEIECTNVRLSYPYLCGNEDISDKGVQMLLMPDEMKGEIQPVTDMQLFHNTPVKEQYHFIPFINWLNDPNGLCYFNGCYHMYYQANPHEQRSGFCYWGHTVSRDLIHWKYMPFSVFPQQELFKKRGFRGGAFSGSACVKNEKIHIFFTRHYGSEKELWNFQEYQVTAESTDGMRFSAEKMIIVDKPESDMTCDFRDPKVSYIEGAWRLVLAGSKDGKPTIFAYRSENLTDWQYTGILLQDTEEEGMECFECPDLFELDGKCVAIAAMMDFADNGEYARPTRYYIGTLRDNQLQTEHTGYLDFGANNYAVQTFGHENSRTAIGWVADFYEEHIFRENGCYGSMTLPRILQIKDGRLFLKPDMRVRALRRNMLLNFPQSVSTAVKVPGNSYNAVIEFSGDTDFDITLMKDGADTLSLIRRGNIIEICSSRIPLKKARFMTEVQCLTQAEIFVDRRVAEVFLNDGEAVGTKIFYTESAEGCFEAKFSDTVAVKELTVYSMDSIWQDQR